MAYSEEELIANDPVTVVLSERGWVRAAKGHELDPVELNYKSGDSYRHAVRGRTNDLLIFFDSTGRTADRTSQAAGRGAFCGCEHGRPRCPDAAFFERRVRLCYRTR